MGVACVGRVVQAGVVMMAMRYVHEKDAHSIRDSNFWGQRQLRVWSTAANRRRGQARLERRPCGLGCFECCYQPFKCYFAIAATSEFLPRRTRTRTTELKHRVNCEATPHGETETSVRVYFVRIRDEYETLARESLSEQWSEELNGQVEPKRKH